MPGKPICDELKAEILACLDAGLSDSAAAEQCKCDRGTVRKVRRACRPDMCRVASRDTKPADPVAAAIDKRHRTRELAIEREHLHAVAGERSFRAFLERLLADAVPALDPPPRFRPARPKASDVDESLILLLSDWHAYETVRPERVLHLNEYNADVLARRAYRVTHGCLSIADRLRRGGYRFPRLVVAANGDMISGTIHEVERHSDAPNVIQAAIGCGLLLAQSLRDLAAGFEDVTVYGTSGNHGRMPDARRVQQKDPTRSWDFLIYSVAKQALCDVPNVRFILPDSYSVVYTVEGWNVYQGHGHDIKSWNSIPFYGISRAATGLNALRTSAGQPIHYFLFSHFHNPGSICAPGSEYFVNGSLIGGTEFSVNGLGRADKPSQWLLGVHKANGVTHRWPIYADADGPAGEYKVRPWE